MPKGNTVRTALLLTIAITAAAQAQPVLYRAGVIHTVAGDSIAGGQMLVDRGRIVAVGKQLLGDDIEYKYDQLIYKPPGNSVELLWHQDAGYGWPGKANHRSATCWLALSAAT